MEIQARDGLQAGSIDRIYEDANAAVWFVAAEERNGFSILESGELRTRTLKLGDLEPDWSLSLDRRRHVWLRQGGVLADLTDPKAARYRLSSDFPQRERGRRSRDFWDHAGRLWVIDDEGLALWKDGVSRRFSARDGLPSDEVTGIAEDASGTVWISTKRGLAHFRENGTEKGTIGKLIDFARERGVPPIPILGDVMFDREGSLWACSPTGLVRAASPRGLMQAAPPPLLELRSITANGELLPLDRPSTLPYDQNGLAFEFAALSFRNEKAVLYTRTLHGAGNGTVWNTVDATIRGSDQRIADYPNLPSGTYQLLLGAVTADGRRSHLDSPAITILSPIWRRLWFIALEVLLGSAALYVVYRLRLRIKLSRQRIENELRAAREMQLGLLPRSDPALAGFDISGTCIPAQEVGGDFFDYLWLDDDKTKLGIVVADVSGKGMRAAMLAVMANGVTRGELDGSHSPGESLRWINRQLHDKTERGSFTAMVFAEIDTIQRTISFANAGQVDPILKRGAEVRNLLPAGLRLPLGARREVGYESTSADLAPGDVVLFSTDGLIEAMNDTGEQFGQERIEAILRGIDGAASKEIVAKLVTETQRFSGKTGYHDDLTVVVVRVS